MNLITVWGSSGAGKTAVALSLAAALAKGREDVLVISNDTRTPSLPVYLPTCNTLTGANSIGGVLEQTTISESVLKDRIHRHPKSEHIYFMGYVSGEVAGMTYRLPQRDTVAGLLRQLQQSPFRYVIIDGDANPVYDPLTLWGLEHSTHVVRVVTPDVKGFEWQKAQLVWLGHNDMFCADKHILVASRITETAPLAAAQCAFGGFAFELPYAGQVGDKLAAGDLLCNFDMPTSIKYERQIALLCGRLKGAAFDG